MNKTTPFISWLLIGTSITTWIVPISLYANGDDRPIPTLECEYSWKFEQCVVANRNGTTRTIKDFVCLQSNDWENILDQIILDVKFQEIDEEVYEYLDALSNDKEFVVDDPNEAIDDVTNNLWLEGYYYKKYKELCHGGILAERASCTWSVPNVIAWSRLKGSSMSRECMTLVENKLDIYTKVADGILKLNKSEVIQDAHQEYVQQERTKYNALLDNMAAVVGNMWRLARGVTHWTPNPLQWVLWKNIKERVSKYI